MEHNHHRWLQDASQEIQRDWTRLHETAAEAGRTQEVGHENETVWAKFLTNWLPPQYEVATRKYIVGTADTPDKPFETDIIVFHPGYPRRLRAESQILAAGVAAAFSTKLTIRPEGLKEAAQDSAKLQRSNSPRQGCARDELWKPFTYGLLAASHAWKAPASTPEENMTRLLSDNDDEFARHPAESVDVVCVADIGVWAKAVSYRYDVHVNDGAESISTAHTEVKTEGQNHLAMFLTALYERLSWDNADMRGLAHDFRASSGWQGSSGYVRHWNAADVLSPEALLKMRSQPWNGTTNTADSKHQMLG